jgi:hypothetical protein
MKPERKLAILMIIQTCRFSTTEVGLLHHLTTCAWPSTREVGGHA